MKKQNTKTKKAILAILCKHDVFMDIPNQIIASTEASKLIDDILKLIKKERMKANIETGLKDFETYQKALANERKDAGIETLAMLADEKYLTGYEEGAKAGKLMVNEKLVKKERKEVVRSYTIDLVERLINIVGKNKKEHFISVKNFMSLIIKTTKKLNKTYETK